MTDTPSLVPLSESNEVYLVLDELLTFGRVWRELSKEAVNEQTVLKLIANGEFHDPVRVVVFNTAEGWSRDVTGEIAEELLEREAREGDLSQSPEYLSGVCWIARHEVPAIRLSRDPKKNGAAKQLRPQD
jgi:hypothetical protein